MNIQLFYWNGCPSYQRALDNLKEALRLEALTDPIEMILVTSEADAHAKRLVGSPTVRVDGEDLEGSEAEARGVTLGCRVYRDAGHTSGLLWDRFGWCCNVRGTHSRLRLAEVRE